MEILANSELTSDQVDLINLLNRSIPGFEAVIASHPGLGKRPFGEWLNSVLLTREAKQALEGFTASDPPLASSAVTTAINSAISSALVQNVYDIDFTAQASQNLQTGGDGTKTIGGVAFYGENVANATTFSIINGTGFRFESDGTARVYNTSTRSAPNLTHKIVDVASGFDPSIHRVRLMARLIGRNMNANTELQRVGFDRYRASPAEAMAAIDRHYNTSDFSAGDNIGWWRANGTQQSAAVNPTDDGSDTATESTEDVVAVSLDPGLGLVQYWTGTWASGWPSIKDMRHRGTRFIDNTAGNPTTPYNDDLAVFLTSYSNGGGSGFITTFANLRLDYW